MIGNYLSPRILGSKSHKFQLIGFGLSADTCPTGRSRYYIIIIMCFIPGGGPNRGIGQCARNDSRASVCTIASKHVPNTPVISNNTS